VLPRQGITGRFANGERLDAKLIDENTKAVFAETIGNPATVATSATSRRWPGSRIAAMCR